MRRLVFLACAMVFIESTLFSVLTPLLPGFRDEYGLSEGSAGLLAGVYAGGTLAMALPAGWLGARLSPRRAAIIALAGLGVSSPMFGFANHIALLDLTRFLQGTAGALLWVSSFSWVISAAPRNHRGRLIGIVMAAAVAGELLGAPLGALAHTIGTAPVFSALAPVCLALIGLALTIPNVEEAAGQTTAEAWGRFRGSMVPRALLMMGVPAMVFGLVIVIGPLRMDGLGGSALLIALAFGCGSAVQAMTSPVVGRLADRVGPVPPYLFGAVVMAVAVTGIGLLGLLPLLFGSIVVLAFGAGFAFTPASTLLADSATAAGLNQAFMSGTSNVAWGGGQMIGSVVGGAAAGMVGFLIPSLVMAAILGVTALMARSLVAPVLTATGEHPLPDRP